MWSVAYLATVLPVIFRILSVDYTFGYSILVFAVVLLSFNPFSFCHVLCVLFLITTSGMITSLDSSTFLWCFINYYMHLVHSLNTELKKTWKSKQIYTSLSEHNQHRFDTRKTHRYVLSPFCLGTGTSIASGDVELVLCTQTSPLRIKFENLYRWQNSCLFELAWTFYRDNYPSL